MQNNTKTGLGSCARVICLTRVLAATAADCKPFGGPSAKARPCVRELVEEYRGVSISDWLSCRAIRCCFCRNYNGSNSYNIEGCNLQHIPLGLNSNVDVHIEIQRFAFSKHSPTICLFTKCQIPLKMHASCGLRNQAKFQVAWCTNSLYFYRNSKAQWVMFKVHLDGLMTHAGPKPWSHSVVYIRSDPPDSI